jgi:hypothetical protein
LKTLQFWLPNYAQFPIANFQSNQIWEVLHHMNATPKRTADDEEAQCLIQKIVKMLHAAASRKKDGFV